MILNGTFGQSRMLCPWRLPFGEGKPGLLAQKQWTDVGPMSPWCKSFPVKAGLPG